jgi:hypothetical protein
MDPVSTNFYATAKLLLAFARTVIFASESHGIHDHLLLSDASASFQTTVPFTH